MIALLAAVPVVAAAPSPSPTPQFDAAAVSPGIVGFLATFAVVLAALGLFQLMTRSLRRTARNARAAGLEVVEPARVGGRVQLPVRAPEPTAPGVLDGGSPYETPSSSDAPQGKPPTPDTEPHEPRTP